MELQDSLIQTPTATRRVDSKQYHRKSSSLFKKTCLGLKFRLWNMYGHVRTFTSAFEGFVAFIILLNIGILVADTFEIVSVNTGMVLQRPEVMFTQLSKFVFFVWIQSWYRKITSSNAVTSNISFSTNDKAILIILWWVQVIVVTSIVIIHMLVPGWFLSVLDCLFLGIYLMEFMMKFLVFGHLYFKAMWNDLGELIYSWWYI